MDTELEDSSIMDDRYIGIQSIVIPIIPSALSKAEADIIPLSSSDHSFITR
jgi:hypothetical protein